jgi:pseudouridine synthase
LAKKVKARVFPVDRLPFNSEGLLILTNDGEIADQLQKNESVPRVYVVKVKGHPNAEMISRLEKGGKVNEEFFKPHTVKGIEELSQKTLVQVVILGTTGVDLKAFFESKGFLVEKVTRTAIGQITLHGLDQGQFRYLKKSQVEALIAQPELGLKSIEQLHEKIDAKKERAMSREERIEIQNERNARQKKVERKKKKERFSDLYGKPGKSWEDRPVRSPKVAATYADQDDQPARMESGFRVRFSQPKRTKEKSSSTGGSYTPTRNKTSRAGKPQASGRRKLAPRGKNKR